LSQTESDVKICHHNTMKENKENLKFHKNIAIILNEDNNEINKNKKEDGCRIIQKI